MKSFFAATRFITILPLGPQHAYDPVGMIPCFPLVGLLLGGIVAVCDHLALMLWPMPVAAVLDVLLLAALTGALHLDGLGDTADGLFSHRPQAEVLRIMKDSRVGMMGLVAVVAALALKWAGIASLQHHRTWLLILVPALARSSMLFGVRFLNYARPEGGTGKPLFGTPLAARAFRWTLLPVGLALCLGGRGLGVLIAFGVFTCAILMLYKQLINGITGDMLGAMTETLESLLFVAAAAGGEL